MAKPQGDGWRKIAIELKIPEKGEEKAQAYDIAWLQHLTLEQSNRVENSSEVSSKHSFDSVVAPRAAPCDADDQPP